MDATATATATPEGEHAVVCLQCGYDLRGQPVTATCPECGLNVLMSVHGDITVAGDPNRLRFMELCAALIGTLAWIGILLEVLILLAGEIAVPVCYAAWMTTLLALGAAVLLAWREPSASPGQGTGWRRAVKYGASAGILLCVVVGAKVFSEPYGVHQYAYFSGVVRFLLIVTLVEYIGRLAPRMGDRGLADAVVRFNARLLLALGVLFGGPVAYLMAARVLNWPGTHFVLPWGLGLAVGYIIAVIVATRRIYDFVRLLAETRDRMAALRVTDSRRD